jgi:hypothetical protein
VAASAPPPSHRRDPRGRSPLGFRSPPRTVSPLQPFRLRSVPATREAPLQTPNRRGSSPSQLATGNARSEEFRSAPLAPNPKASTLKISLPPAVRARPSPKPKPQELTWRLQLRLRRTVEIPVADRRWASAPAFAPAFAPRRRDPSPSEESAAAGPGQRGK